MDTNAIWLARKESYLVEASRSACSFKAHYPNVTTVLYTPDSITEREPFDRVIRVKYDESVHHYLNWMRTYLLFFDLAADKLLFFDTDIYIYHRFDDVLRLLNHYDLCAAHAPGRHTTDTLYPNFEAFPEINIGFVAMRNNDACFTLFKRALHLYERQTSVYKNNDQGPLRDALLMWSGRLCILPPEYNFRTCIGGQVRGPIRVIHGRVDDYEATEQRVNKHTGVRIITPKDL